MTLAGARMGIITCALIVWLAIFQLSNERALALRAVPGTPLHQFGEQAFAAQIGSAALDIREQYFPTIAEHRFQVALALEQARALPTRARLLKLDRLIARLPADDERLAQEAAAALLRGNTTAALRLGIGARADQVVESALDRLERQRQFASATAWNRVWIAQLEASAIDREALAQALWRAARYENRAAEFAKTPALRTHHIRVALTYVRRELLLTPLSGQALLTAGYAALALGFSNEAESDFRATIAADPASASGYVGRARVALYTHDAGAAKAAAEQAYRIAPLQADVVALRNALAAR